MGNVDVSAYACTKQFIKNKTLIITCRLQCTGKYIAIQEALMIM